MRYYMKNIKIKGGKNFRSLEGIRCDGGYIKPACFIRAGHLSRLTDGDIKTLCNEYKLKTVIDLRNSVEKEEKPDRIIDGVNYLEMPVFDSSVPGLSHETKQDLDGIPDMTELYRYVVNSECLNNLAEVVRRIILLRNDELSVLYHCTEGKDRTGMVTALLLLTLGASKENILKDYLYTNKVNRKKAIGYFLLVRIFKHKIKAARLVYGVFIARREYINELFEVYDAIGRKNFLKNYLKLTEEDIADFKERVLWE